MQLTEGIRKPEYPVEKFIIERWSPRAMSGEEISDNELMTLFEAGKWAPSSYNNQPWRFIYAKRETDVWEKFLDLLVEFNKQWAQNAGALVAVASRKTFEENNKPARTHSFDAGAACENMALQGSAMGLVIHGMEGFDYDKAREEMKIPDDYDVEAMFAIGRPGNTKDLPEGMQEREFPSGRKKLSEIVFEGEFK